MARGNILEYPEHFKPAQRQGNELILEIVQEPDNPERHYPISDEVFRRKYELVPE